ncbi:MAG: hypothetical protein EBY16_02975 [Gammaproteobacteria bacterium]|nr:hypothetical protein [Gammaproteobacteria bacterium]
MSQKICSHCKINEATVILRVEPKENLALGTDYMSCEECIPAIRKKYENRQDRQVRLKTL